MSWAKRHIEALQRGERVSFRPVGHSMEPRIKSRQLCTVAPVRASEIQPDDVVLCRVAGRDLLHIVKEIKFELRNGKPNVFSYRFLIGNNRGHINGWTHLKFIWGKLERVED